MFGAATSNASSSRRSSGFSETVLGIASTSWMKRGTQLASSCFRQVAKIACASKLEGSVATMAATTSFSPGAMPAMGTP